MLHALGVSEWWLDVHRDHNCSHVGVLYFLWTQHVSVGQSASIFPDLPGFVANLQAGVYVLVELVLSGGASGLPNRRLCFSHSFVFSHYPPPRSGYGDRCVCPQGGLSVSEKDQREPLLIKVAFRWPWPSTGPWHVLVEERSRHGFILRVIAL